MKRTIETGFCAVPIQDNAPLLKVSAGIDELHALGDASLCVKFVRTFLIRCMELEEPPTVDEIFVLDRLLEQAQALRRAARAE
jgi:hypothetical protein